MSDRPIRAALAAAGCLACILAAGAPPAPAATIYVNHAAGGENTGLSWADAFNSLQSALAVAVAGDEIWVAAGIYTPTTGTDRNATFQLKPGVNLRGGFLGDESDPAQRPADPDPLNADPASDSILSGDIGAPGFGDNSFRVVTGTGVTPGTTLDRFVITSGESTTTLGAGMTNDPGSPTVRDCLFENNTAFGGGGMFNNRSPNVVIDRCVFRNNSATTPTNGRGGGVQNFGGSSCTITDSVFLDNTAATSAGALYNSTSTCTVRRCTFDGNTTAGNDGGAVWNFASACTIEDSTFRNNSSNLMLGSSTGGAVSCFSSSCNIRRCAFISNRGWQGNAIFTTSSTVLALDDCDFDGNTGGLVGGAIFLFSSTSFASITNCAFTNNSAGATGGAIYSTLANAIVQNCTFTNNSSNGGNGGGAVAAGASMTVQRCLFTQNRAALASGGAISVFGGAPLFLNCAIAGNTAPSGGAITVSSTGTPRFVNCLIAANTAGGLGGGAILNGSSVNARFINCTVAANAAGSFGGGFACFNGSTTTLAGCIVRGNTAAFDPQLRLVSSTFSASYTNFQGGWIGTGNIDADPLFLNPADPDGADNLFGNEDDGYTLTPGSPCLDAADNAAIEAAAPGAELELSAFARFRDDPAATDSGAATVTHPAIADMGAYERQPPPACPGDADGDGIVGLSDVALMIQNWSDTHPPVPPYTMGDLTGDGLVGLADIAIVIQNWGTVCP